MENIEIKNKLQAALIGELVQKLSNAEKKINELKQDNEQLMRYLSVALDGRKLVYGKNNEEAPLPKFAIGENMGGDLIISIVG